MPALKPTDFTATIVWLGVVPDSASNLRATSLERTFASFAGFAGECHGGLTRKSCSRVTEQHPRGTEIANVRQLSILSRKEMQVIADRMGLNSIDPAQLGASMVIDGIPGFTHVPPSARLQAPSGATFVVDMENRPCVLPGREIEKDHAGYGKTFKAAARGVRGVTAWVEREGDVAVGDGLRLYLPDQPAWPYA